MKGPIRLCNHDFSVAMKDQWLSLILKYVLQRPTPCIQKSNPLSKDLKITPHNRWKNHFSCVKLVIHSWSWNWPRPPIPIPILSSFTHQNRHSSINPRLKQQFSELHGIRNPNQTNTLRSR